MTQLRSPDTKAVLDLWTSIQHLKYLCHRTSDPEAHWKTCRPFPIPGDIMVYPCPVLDPAHLAVASHEFGTDRIASSCLSL
jgi:hypothetical protein